jgi:hypothetical protein
MTRRGEKAKGAAAGNGGLARISRGQGFGALAGPWFIVF